MANSVAKNKEEKEFRYSKMLSSLFCSASIISLSILCLLNHLSIDFYSAFILLKVVLPAAVCFWFLGFFIGKILDQTEQEKIIEKEINEQKAYEIPSMFSMNIDVPDDNTDISVGEV